MKNFIKTNIVTPLKWLWSETKRERVYTKNYTVWVSYLSGIILGMIIGLFFKFTNNNQIPYPVFSFMLFGLVLGAWREALPLLDLIKSSRSAVSHAWRFALLHTILFALYLHTESMSVLYIIPYFVLSILIVDLIYITLKYRTKEQLTEQKNFDELEKYMKGQA